MQGKQMQWRLLLPLGMLLLAALACGGFQVRVTPTPTPPPTAAVPPTATPVVAAAAPTIAPQALPSPTLAPSATPTQNPRPPAAKTSLAVGMTARVKAAGGLNVRNRASSKGKQVGTLQPGAAVTLTGGPTQAENYTWWKVDNGAGLVGWVAAGPANDPWLVADASSRPATSSGELVNRPVRLGDRVQVTTQAGQVLTIREAAGTSATALARVLRGTQFTVRGGPVRQDGYIWWQLESQKVNGWAAEGEGPDRWLTPIEP